MDTPTALLTLIHVLVLAYWLGGDLGAFYSSSFLTSPTRSVPERMLALKILNNVDMAPRTALILALPTGLALAWMKGWVTLEAYVPALVALFCLGWLALAWAVHLKHGAGTGLRNLDLAIRWIVLAALITVGVLAAAERIDLPLFIGLKMWLLATCIVLGLVIRRKLSPIGPPIAEMASSGATPETDAAISDVISGTRPVVVALWLCLLAATYLGIATPV